jgi:hypothetical protein
MPLYNSSFIHGAIVTRRTSLLTDAWNNWGYDEGRSMRFPSVLNGPCSDETVYVVLYECEFWSLTLREDHRVRVFEKRVLRRMFGPNRDEVTGGWRKLHNEELHNFYSLPNIIRMIRSRRMGWAGHVV